MAMRKSPFYVVPDSYSRAQTRESIEPAKKGLKYESFEYESRLDPSLIPSSLRVGAAEERTDCRRDRGFAGVRL